MSTRCNVFFYDRGRDGWKDGPILYHHFDGYPECMIPKLRSLLQVGMKRSKEGNRGASSEVLAAIVVAESMAPDGIPPFEPCRCRHDDIEYSYHVYVGPNEIQILAEHRDDGIVEKVAVSGEVAV